MFRARNPRPKQTVNRPKPRLLKFYPRKLRGSWPKPRVSPAFPGPNPTKPPLFARADFSNQQKPKRNHHFYVEKRKTQTESAKPCVTFCFGFYTRKRSTRTTRHSPKRLQGVANPALKHPATKASGGGRRQGRSLKIIRNPATRRNT